LLEKHVKNKNELQRKVDIDSVKLAEKERERNLIEERLNNTKTLMQLKAQESELKRQNEEDQAIAQNERVEERNDELARLQTQIAERDTTMPLRERIKEIFKKHGVPVTAILLAAGVTIGSVVGSIAKALKATGKAMAGALKDIGAKLGSLLPGLIGQVAHFLFNTASKAVDFLAEHTWLLILAAVVFIFEKYIKKRR